MNGNHSYECIRIVPVPDHAYYEARTVCVCGLQTFENRRYTGANNNQNKTTEQGNTPQIA